MSSSASIPNPQNGSKTRHRIGTAHTTTSQEQASLRTRAKTAKTSAYRSNQVTTTYTYSLVDPAVVVLWLRPQETQKMFLGVQKNQGENDIV